MRCKAHARLDAHRSRWVAGAARRWCGVHRQAGKVLVLAERSAASAQRCRQRGVVACASFPERALSARGAQRNFCRCELLTTRGECNASLLGHRPRSCALCWHRAGAAVECSPQISRVLHTGGKGRTSGCLLLREDSGHGSRAHICAATFGRHESTTPSLRLFSRARTTIFATLSALFFA